MLARVRVGQVVSGESKVLVDFALNLFVKQDLWIVSEDFLSLF